MKKDELVAHLCSRKVPRQMYSLGEIGRGECYSVIPDFELWKVVYVERGKVSDIQSGLTEDEAYELVYQEFKNMYGWTN